MEISPEVHGPKYPFLRHLRQVDRLRQRVESFRRQIELDQLECKIREETPYEQDYGAALEKPPETHVPQGTFAYQDLPAQEIRDEQGDPGRQKFAVVSLEQVQG